MLSSLQTSLSLCGSNGKSTVSQQVKVQRSNHIAIKSFRCSLCRPFGRAFPKVYSHVPSTPPPRPTPHRPQKKRKPKKQHPKPPKTYHDISRSYTWRDPHVSHLVGPGAFQTLASNLSQRVQVPSEDGCWGVKRGLSTSLEGTWTLWVCFNGGK